MQRGTQGSYRLVRAIPGNALGRVLRATALDELPQVVNILKGDTKFVEPNAVRPELAEKFSKELANFPQCLMVRPGITGIAQIFRRYDSPPG